MRRIAYIAATLAFASPAFALDCDDGFHAFTHAAGETCIPNDPQRIVSLHDLSITLPLVELGEADQIVGSQGRTDTTGQPFLRGVKDVFDVSFDNSDIAFVGVDAEAIAALSPDLIIGRAPFDVDSYDNYSQIAPTVLIDLNNLDYFGRLSAIADIAGETAQFNRKAEQYDASITEVRRLIPNPEDITVSFIMPNARSGTIEIYDDYYAL